MAISPWCSYRWYIWDAAWLRDCRMTVRVFLALVSKVAWLLEWFCALLNFPFVWSSFVWCTSAFASCHHHHHCHYYHCVHHHISRKSLQFSIFCLLLRPKYGRRAKLLPYISKKCVHHHHNHQHQPLLIQHQHHYHHRHHHHCHHHCHHHHCLDAHNNPHHHYVKVFAMRSLVAAWCTSWDCTSPRHQTSNKSSADGEDDNDSGGSL